MASDNLQQRGLPELSLLGLVGLNNYYYYYSLLDKINRNVFLPWYTFNDVKINVWLDEY